MKLRTLLTDLTLSTAAGYLGTKANQHPPLTEEFQLLSVVGLSCPDSARLGLWPESSSIR
jgi:hypothetical protein